MLGTLEGMHKHMCHPKLEQGADWGQYTERRDFVANDMDNADPQKAVLSARGDKNGAPEKPVNTFVQPPQALQNHIDPKPSDTVQQNTVSSH